MSVDAHSVRFRYKDYACGERRRMMELSAHEFLRRFTLHVLPRGFNRIRHYTAIEPRMHARQVRSPYARVLTPVDPSAIVRASPSAHRLATRTTHARHAAHLAAPAVAFNSQVQPLPR